MRVYHCLNERWLVAQDDEALLGESADLVYHLLVLLRSRGLSLEDVERVLRERHG